ncbi:permease prefix domain 1-containing protein [Paenibacillus sp. An7]|uniref:permease prefix domain 1-containing protein n=1 Tax=Paenibacillus sp. An7 TaxID=2689577 RepID=UPI001358D7A0|nr:permease prefix domain 1-containing protein [Paenibacillus sp. An7]
MKQIDSYVNAVYQNVGGNKKEIQELKEEMRIHLIETANELIKEGLPEEEAIKMAIQRFGDEKSISSGLTELFKYQKKFTTNLFRVAVVSVILAAISFFSIIQLEEGYQSSLKNMTQGILNVVNNEELISTTEIKIIEEHTAEFQEKYDTLSYLGVFYDDNQDADLHEPNEAQYIYPENATFSKDKINYGVGSNNWYVEAQLEDDYRDYFYLIPYSFLIISFVLLLVWLVSKIYNRKQYFNFEGK